METYSKRAFEAPLPDGSSWRRDVYSKGDGPLVIIMQELPGIGPETLALADRLVDAGFSVALPHLFGPLGRISMLGNTLRVMCMRREFSLFAKGRSSPVTAWLAALCRDERDRRGVKGVGVIGMCLTGNFALSLLADDSVLAGVASQPSLPVRDHGDLHMSEETAARVRERLDTLEPALALRFEGDKLCRAARFEAIEETFNEDKTRVRMKTLPGEGHSVLTLHFVDEDGHPTREALADVLAYFKTALAA